MCWGQTRVVVWWVGTVVDVALRTGVCWVENMEWMVCLGQGWKTCWGQTWVGG